MYVYICMFVWRWRYVIADQEYFFRLNVPNYLWSSPRVKSSQMLTRKLKKNYSWTQQNEKKLIVRASSVELNIFDVKRKQSLANFCFLSKTKRKRANTISAVFAGCCEPTADCLVISYILLIKFSFRWKRVRFLRVKPTNHFSRANKNEIEACKNVIPSFTNFTVPTQRFINLKLLLYKAPFFWSFFFWRLAKRLSQTNAS